MKNIFFIYLSFLLLFSLDSVQIQASPEQQIKIKSLEKTIHIAKKKGDHHTVYSSYDAIGQVYNEEQNFYQAARYFRKAARIAEVARKKTNLIKAAYLKSGTAFGDSKEYKEAVEDLEKALTLSIIENDNNTELICYSLLAEYNSQLGNTIKADEYLTYFNRTIKNSEEDALATQKINELKSKIENVIAAKKLAELELKSQKTKLVEISDNLKEKDELVKKNQMEIDLLNKDKELVEAKLDHQKLLKNSIIGFVILLTILIVVLVLDYRKKIETNKHIALQNENITSSINYAKRIQEAMLPKRDDSIPLMNNSFILFKPRDTISGDFYWFSELSCESGMEKDVVFAAVDGTGHSVPGAFMSMIGMNCLSGIVSRGTQETNKILSELHSEIRTALRQPETGNNDGMDIGICIYRKSKNILEFSGGKHPLVYVQNDEIHMIKGDPFAMGGSTSEPEIEFTKHEILIDQPTMIYMFSDGYCDQFGGPGDKKFLSANLRKLLHKIHTEPLEQQKEILDKTIEEWRGKHEQTDDILVMGIRIEPSIA